MRAYASFIVGHRLAVLVLTLALTLVLGLQLRNLSIIVDADELLPKTHPFVEVTERVEDVFGNRFTVVVGITPKTGDVYTPEVLGKLLTATERLAATSGVTRGNIQSLAAPRAKDISGDAEGLRVARLLDHVPVSLAEAQAVKVRLAANPAYRNVLVSEDGRTAAIYVEFEKDPKGFGHVVDKVEAAIAPIRDDSVRVSVSGQPVFLGTLETFSKRMAWLLPLAILLIGLIHFEAFRTLQGLILPLVTAILALVWSLGIMTLAGVHLDPFNNVTPILILAVAAGHAVQMLKRYYEEFDRVVLAGENDKRLASREAIITTMVRVGPVMLAACTIAALSFMSLVWFDIQAVRTFGIFSGLGIFSIAVVELTFTPAVRAMLPPPPTAETHAESAETVWDRLALFLSRQVETPAARKRVFIVSGVVCAVLLAGASQVQINNSLKSFFGADLPERQDDAFLNSAMAGTNTFYVLVEGKSDDAIKDPAVLRAMQKTEAFLNTRPEIGHTLSLVDMLTQINRGMNGGGESEAVLPDNADLISQYLLLYSMSGEPGDFDGLVDYPYRNAIIQAFVKTDSSAFVAAIDRDIAPVIKANFPDSVTVRLGGSVTTPTAMNEVMVSGKIKNIAQILIVVFAVSSLLFRSWRLAALILVPLLLTIAAVFGIMGLAGIPLQIATATMAALAVGIGADYAIYFAWRLREELRTEPDEVTAIRATYRSAGKAVLFVATAVGGGYAVLMASIGFNIHFWLGLLTMASMFTAATSSLTLFAALLLTTRPRVIFGEAGAAPATSALKASPAALALLVAGAGLAVLPATPVQAAESVDATKMMADSLIATKPLRSKSEGRFVLTNKEGQKRVRETDSVTELKADGVHNRRVVRFGSPADIKGTAVLTIENDGDDDIWVYLPAMKKVRRLAASNKKDAFVGTDFSYGDVLGHRVEDWNQKFVRKEMLDGKPVVVIESTPKTPTVAANSGYSKRLSWLRAADAVDVKAEYYGPDGKLLKVYTASDIRLVDPKNKRYQPMRQLMTNVSTGHSTLIEYDEYSTDIDIPETQFQPRALERTP
jgi:hydrophobe/amphiphile efflux-3 (HAE3) family protein